MPPGGRLGPRHPTPRHAHALGPFQWRTGPAARMGREGTSSRHRLQTIATCSAARSIWAVPSPLNQTPGKISSDSSFTLNITGEPGGVRAGQEREGGQERLPPANSSPLGASSPGARGGPGPGGPARGPSLLTSRGPLLLTFSRSLSATAFGPGSCGGAASRRKEPARTRGRDLAPGRRAGGPGSRTPPLSPGAPARRARWRPGSGGGSPGPPTSARRRGPRPLPAHPQGRGPGGRARAGAAPSPPPSPGGGAGEAVTSRGARWRHLPAR